MAKAKIETGDNFTLALRENGTVWSYGNGEKGSLGNGDKTNKLEPVEVLDENGKQVDNIIDIAAGNTNAILLTKDKKVYTFGTFDKLDNAGNIVIETKETPEIESSLTDIEKISAHRK